MKGECIYFLCFESKEDFFFNVILWTKAETHKNVSLHDDIFLTPSLGLVLSVILLLISDIKP